MLNFDDAAEEVKEGEEKPVEAGEEVKEGEEKTEAAAE